MIDITAHPIRTIAFLLVASALSFLILKPDILYIGGLFILLLSISLFVMPKYYILFWLMFAALSGKISVPGYDITSYGVMNLIFLPVLTIKVLIHHRRDLLEFPTWKSYLLLLTGFFISIWYSPVLLLAIRKYCNFVIPFLFGVLMVGFFTKQNVLNRYMKITAAAVGVMAITDIVMYYLGSWILEDRGIFRATGISGHPNDEALFLNINLAVTLSLALSLRNKREKIFYSLISLVCVLSIILTFSKTGYIMIALTVFLVPLLAMAKNKNFWPIFPICGLVLLLSVVLFSYYQKFISYRLADQSTFISRVEIWQGVIPRFYEHPFFGNGFMSSEEMVRRLFPQSGGWVVLASTHNLFIRILVEAGIVGLLCFLIGYLSMFRYGLKVFWGSKDTVTVGLATGFLVFSLTILVYSIVGDSFFTPMVNLYFWFYFSFMVCFFKIEKI